MPAVIKTLTRPSDIIYYTMVSPEFPPCDLRAIYGIEYFEGLNCLGIEFYNELLADVVDYSNTLPYNPATNYLTGDTVQYKGVYYRALMAVNGVIPTTVDKWELAPRFEKECFETLWCSFLAEYLSWVIIRNRLPFIANKIAAEGITKVMGENFKAADDKDFHTVQKGVFAQIDRAYTNFHAYVTEGTKECYIKYKGNQATGCKGGDCLDAKEGNYEYRFG